MAREITAEDVVNMVGEPDWDNSDTSSGEEDHFTSCFIPEDPLQQAENAAKLGEDSDETNSESASITLDETEPSRDSVVTSYTSGSSTLPVTSFNPLVPNDHCTGRYYATPECRMTSTLVTSGSS